MSKKEQFLKERTGGVSQHHKEYLGMDVPEGYFSSSKQSILDLVKEEKSEIPVFYLRRTFQVAASITLLVVLAVAIQFGSGDNLNDDFGIASDDTLIESLFVEEDDMNSFLDEVLVSEVVVEAEKSEQELENILMNSLFLEDSLVDSYTKESLIDNIIL